MSAKWGVRLSRGIVTHWNNEPLMTLEQAEECRAKIEQVTGEWGEIEKVLLCAAASPSPETSGE